MREPRSGQVVTLAEDHATARSRRGFACACHRRRPGLGLGCVNNLHVVPDRKGGGIGRILMRELGRRLAAAAPKRPVHLFCLEENHAARGFYASLGGQVVERMLSIEADGMSYADLRIAWTSPARILENSGVGAAHAFPAIEAQRP